MTPLTPRQFIDALIDRGELFQIARDWEHFEREGAIGDCMLRDCAKQYVNQFPQVARPPIVHVMRDLAFEVYRALARASWGSENLE